MHVTWLCTLHKQCSVIFPESPTVISESIVRMDILGNSMLLLILNVSSFSVNVVRQPMQDGDKGKPADTEIPKQVSQVLMCK